MIDKWLEKIYRELDNICFFIIVTAICQMVQCMRGFYQ